MKGLTKKNLAANLKGLREAVHMEQKVVAKVLGIPRSAVAEIERGRRHVTALELAELCKLFRVSPNELLRWDAARSPGDAEKGE